jgi:plastocyanin
MEVIYGEIDRSVILGHASSIGDVQQRVGGERRRTRTGYGHLACLGWRRERRSCASGTGVPTHVHHDQRRRHDYLETGAEFVHTVTFVSGGQVPPVVAPEGNIVIQPAATAYPSGGPNYDGTGFVNSGLLEGKGKTFSLTFTKAGTYDYICLLHPGMGGQVAVQAAGSAYPKTQAQVDAQGNTELYAKLSQANQDLQSAQLTSNNGAGGNQASVLRFLPVNLTVKPGDSLTWLGNDPHEVHTVTFYDPAGKVPDFLVPQPQPSGPPKLLVPHAKPEGDIDVDSNELYGSGLLPPGQAYTFTFPKPGVYTYVCVIHAPQGMFGTITVAAAGQPAGAVGRPASLPNTGTGGSESPLLVLLAGAIALMLLGILSWRIALRFQHGR